MELTYKYGSVYVDDFVFNGNLPGIIQRIFNDINVEGEMQFTPYEIIFHNCKFKDTHITLDPTDYIVLDNVGLLYFFNKEVSKFCGEYNLNLTIKFEYCDFYVCAWPLGVYPSYIPVYDKDHKKIVNLGIFIEYNKIKYNNPEELPSYSSSVTTGYKILCESVSSHIKRYYLCKLIVPADATVVATIAGELRSNMAYVENIMQIANVNMYKYDDEMTTILQPLLVTSIHHSSFAGKHNNFIDYTVGDTIRVDNIETRSFRSLGNGIYMFALIDNAIDYLNRVLPKEATIINKPNGRVENLSREIKKIGDVYSI